MMTRLEDATWQLELDPRHGASWRALRWRHPDGRWRALLLDLQGDGFGGGNFIMAPFCNRICDGRFSHGAIGYQLALNQPEEAMAIHGHARDLAWEIAAQAPDHLHLALTSRDAIWQYHIEQQIRLAGDQLIASLRLRNLGAHAMPFGIGFHPWFPRQPLTHVSFASQGAHRQDARALPLAAQEQVAGLDPQDPQPLDRIAALDHCFSGWQPREARAVWPEAGYQIRLRSSGALRHLQLYSPSGCDYFCLEPVSHLPDAINRPALAPFGAMDLLAPQAELCGEMRLQLSPI